MKYIEKRYLEKIVDKYREEKQKLNTSHNDTSSFEIGGVVYYIRANTNPYKCRRGKVEMQKIRNNEDLCYARYGSACGWAFDNYEDAVIALNHRAAKLLKWVYQFLEDCLQKICLLEKKVDCQQKQLEEYQKQVEKDEAKIKQLLAHFNNTYLGYKQFFTYIHYSAANKVLYGKIEGIEDLVDFESESAAEIENEFHKAVDDYIAFCREVEKNVGEEKGE